MAVGGQPPKPRKGRVALIAGSVVLALGLTGGGVLALTNGWFSQGAGGAGSPEAAAVSFLESAAKLDGADLMASVAPSERAVLSDLTGNLPGPSSNAQAAVDDARNALEITFPDQPTFKAEELVPGVSRAKITSGSVKIDGDVDRLTDAVISIMEATGTSSDETDDARDKIRREIDKQLPVQKDLTDLVSMTDLGNDLFLVAVEEDGKWYVSASMTIAQYAAEADGVTKDQLGKPIPAAEMKKFKTPEEAVTGLYDAIDTAVDNEDLRELAKALPPAESRLLAVYGPVLNGSGGSRSSGDGSPLTLSDLSASTLKTDGDHAYVALDSFTVDGGSDETVEYRRDGKKFTIDFKERRNSVLSIVVDGNDPKRWALTVDDPTNDINSLEASLSVPRKGEVEGEFTLTSDHYYGATTETGSFSFDGDCLQYTYDDGDSYGKDSGKTCNLAESVKGTGLENITELPDLSRLMSVTTLKSDGSWYVSPSASLISGLAELARAFQP